MNYHVFCSQFYEWEPVSFYVRLGCSLNTLSIIIEPCQYIKNIQKHKSTICDVFQKDLSILQCWDALWWKFLHAVASSSIQIQKAHWKDSRDQWGQHKICVWTPGLLGEFNWELCVKLFQGASKCCKIKSNMGFLGTHVDLVFCSWLLEALNLMWEISSQALVAIG